jgi:membrane-associated protein
MELIHFALDLLRNLEQNLTDLAGANLLAFYAVLFLIIFAETGLVVTPVLPGDSLLFLTGAIAFKLQPAISIPLLLGLLIAAAVLGDAVNYAIGYRLGPKVFKYERSWFFNKKHLWRAQAFYEKYGSKTILLARFVPIVRTFAPFVAGIGKMQYRRFASYNVVGGMAWVLTCVGSGYFFGGLPWVKQHFELVVIAIVIISVLPMVFEFVLQWRRGRSARRPAVPDLDLLHGANSDQPGAVGAEA